MNKRLFILIFLLSASLYSTSQITFQKTYGGTNQDKGYSIEQTNDGGYIITGMTMSFGAGSEDVYLIKTDTNGDIIWDRSFGGTGLDRALSVQQTNDGGYIIAGTTLSFGAGDNDVYLIKTNAIGNMVWRKTFGGTGLDAGYSVQQTNDGGYIIAGESQSFGEGVYLIKTNANGNIMWTKTYGGGAGEWGQSIRQTNDGGYIIAGTTLSFGAGNFDFYLIKTDSIGDTLWTKTFGGINS